jgi:hypothetical protein
MTGDLRSLAFHILEMFDLALQLHFEGYKEASSELWKREREFNFESKVTLEKLLFHY